MTEISLDRFTWETHSKSVKTYPSYCISHSKSVKTYPGHCISHSKSIMTYPGLYVLWIWYRLTGIMFANKFNFPKRTGHNSSAKLLELPSHSHHHNSPHYPPPPRTCTGEAEASAELGDKLSPPGSLNDGFANDDIEPWRGGSKTKEITMKNHGVKVLITNRK
mgnify:CR=1 FL=1